MRNDDLEPSVFRGSIGIARVDITPPVGISARNWGAGNNHIAQGVHRPLTLTCMAIRSESDDQPALLISADLGWWKMGQDERSVREPILSEFGLDESRLLLCLSHTHSGPSLCAECAAEPGSELIINYLETLRRNAIAASAKAIERLRAATLTWRYGRCDLATNRDLPDDIDTSRFLCGFNPYSAADDTLLVGRITDLDGRVLGTIANYACHPTTLAWENHLLSPDYVGALREVVESATQAPCLFLQGASGELAPAEQYSGDVALADRHGRRVGFAVLSALEAMAEPESQLTFNHVVESGAPLAVWRREKMVPDTMFITELVGVPLQLMPLPSTAQIEREWQTCTDPALKERLWRRRGVRKTVGDGATVSVPLWIWRLGNSLLVAHPNEAYSLLQTELRQRFAPRAIAVSNVANGSIGYLPPRELYGKNVYPAWQTPFERGSLERVIAAAERTIESLRRSGTNGQQFSPAELKEIKL